MLFSAKYIWTLFLCTGFIVQQYPGNRILYVFGQPYADQLVRQQLQLLEQEKAGVVERDLEIIAIKEGDHLYQRFKVPPRSFTVVLVGKDGTEKYRSDTLLTPQALFAIIDAMPMRKAEMNKRR